MSNGILKIAENKPIQFGIASLILVGGLGVGIAVLNKRSKNKKEKNQQEKTETDQTANNPFAYSVFLSQKIPSGTPLLKVAIAQSASKQVYNSLNTYFSDSPDIAIGVFSSLGSKLKIAQVCQAFYNTYKRDILEFLKNGKKTFDFGTGGLSNDNYQRIITIVNNKPKF